MPSELPLSIIDSMIKKYEINQFIMLLNFLTENMTHDTSHSSLQDVISEE
jgi:hypothetical protein